MTSSEGLPRLRHPRHNYLRRARIVTGGQWGELDWLGRDTAGEEENDGHIEGGHGDKDPRPALDTLAL